MSINTSTVCVCHRTIPSWGRHSSKKQKVKNEGMGAVYTNCWINKVRKDTTCSSDCIASSSECPRWIWYQALEGDGGITLISRRNAELRDQTGDVGVAGLGAKFTGNTNTVISLCTLLLLPIVASKKKKKKKKKGRSSSHTAVCGERHRLAPDFFVLCSACAPPGQNVQDTATALGNYLCGELVLNAACSVSENTYSRCKRTNRWCHFNANIARMGKCTWGALQALQFSHRLFNSAAVLRMVWVGTHEAGHVTQQEGLQKTVGHTGEQRKLMLQVYCSLKPVNGAMLITPRWGLRRGGGTLMMRNIPQVVQWRRMQEKRSAFLFWIEW